MTGIRERIIQCQIKLRKQTKDSEENYRMMQKQVQLFNEVEPVMSKVDLPSEFWHETKEKMEKELANLKIDTAEQWTRIR